MAGYTSPPFRLLCCWMGAELVYTELISAEGLTREPNYRRSQLMLSSLEHPVAVQLFGADPRRLAESAAMAEAAGADIIDLNLGCPAPVVTHSGGGAALAAQPAIAVKCVRAMVEAVRVPITAKLRAGLQPGDTGYIDLASRLVDAGVSALALHGRSVKQGFRGHADWRTISALVKAAPVPVLGNGDVACAADAVRMLRETGCKGVLIGRAAVGDPWLFARSAAVFGGQEEPAPPSPLARLAVMLWYVHRLAKDFGEKEAVRLGRLQLTPFSRGLPGAVALRRSLGSARSFADLRTAVLVAWATVVGEKGSA